MTEPAAGDRRAPVPEVCTANRPGMARRWAAAVRAALYRPLAADDDRVAHWVRHVRDGILLTELAAVFTIGYSLLTHTAGRRDPRLIGLCLLVMAAVPLLLLLPLPAMMRDSRGPTMFYLWSVATAAVVLILTRLDGGSTSPIDALLFLTLGYLASAYSPAGVLLMGGFMAVSYLVVVELPEPSMSGLFFIAVMALFTMICAMSTASSWAAYDRQLLLIRTQETLASTDPLTGIPNRRAYLERVASAVDAAAGSTAGSRPMVVCLVDLDAFKSVNDTCGHAAGDAMLQSVATALSGAVRASDTVARLGGDEFAVLAETSAGLSGEVLAERLRDAVASVGRPFGVTASVGVAEVATGGDVAELMHRADAAMYRSKVAGGDRVTVQPA